MAKKKKNKAAATWQRQSRSGIAKNIERRGVKIISINARRAHALLASDRIARTASILRALYLIGSAR